MHVLFIFRIFLLCILFLFFIVFFFFKQKTAYEMRISDWSSDVCSSDLAGPAVLPSPHSFLESSRALRAARGRRVVLYSARWLARPASHKGVSGDYHSPA